jgi:hypothetical protein
MRVALLGSPGIGVPFRLPFRVTGGQATKLGAGATYAAVVAGHHLDLSFNGIPQAIIIPFTGAEATQAAFNAVIQPILRALGMPTGATAVADVVNSGGEELFSAPFLGTFSGGAVLGSTSADVLASLGITATAFAAAVAGLTMFAGRAARQVGGPPQIAGAVNQHYVFLGSGMPRGVMVLDRNVLAAVSADSVRINPSGLP